MFATILSAITGLFKPATELIDKVSTTEQERLELRNELAKIEAGVQSQVIELTKKTVEAELAIKTAEINSNNWLVAGWRPLTSILLVGLVIYHSYSGKPMPEQLGNLIEMFLGVYSGGRSIEKIASSLKFVKK
jgi:hypothetical protein